jgi:cellulose synthase/poly-beta-1,6-N-acetylglucosamine synthase-like glycosyltransferase
MTYTEVTLACATALALAFVLYTYVGYPTLIAGLARAFGRTTARPVVADDDLPDVTLVIAAYNEQRYIRERIENALTVDYPAGKFRVLVASDGSSDETEEIVREYAPAGVQLAAFDRRRGKATVLNDVLPDVESEIIVLSDANTFTHPSAVRHLAAWFKLPQVGVVCGRLVLNDPKGGRNCDGVYWKYETFLKKRESRLGALLGSNGGIYAIRRDVYTPIPNDTLVDDFVIPLKACERTGCKLVYDTDAIAEEETPETMVSEFHRRARIGAGGFQSIGILRNLLYPKHGWVTFTFVNHKLFRWVCPFALLAALVFNLLWLAVAVATGSAGAWAAGLTLAAQAAFYATAAAARFLPSGGGLPVKLLRLPAMFTMMNAALGVGFIRWLRGRQAAAWVRTSRAGELTMAGSASDTGRLERPTLTMPRSDDTPSAIRLQTEVGS